jgi:hypothetical protein
MAPNLRSRAASTQLPSTLQDSDETTTLQAQFDMTRQTPRNPDASGSEGPIPDPLLSDREQELIDEEARIDAEIAVARREASLRLKRAELEQLQRLHLIVPATPPDPLTPPPPPPAEQLPLAPALFT